MKHGISHIIKLLDNSHSKVRQSGVNAFRELAAHRKETLRLFIHLPIICSRLPRSSIPQIIKLLDDWQVCRSCANAFGELAAHRKETSCYLHLPIIRRSIPRNHEAWDPEYH
jgi:hypothetical protein